MATSLWLLTALLPKPVSAEPLADRLAYALQANVFAAMPLMIVISAIANARFMSDAIDPTRGSESKAMEIDRRVAENTLEQNFIFLIASLTLSTVVPLQYLQVVWACAIVFVAARLAFWIGYRLSPLYRAPGMAATSYMNLGMVVYALFRIFAHKFT